MMNVGPCPRGHPECHLLSTTNEYKYYCPTCDERFTSLDPITDYPSMTKLRAIGEDVIIHPIESPEQTKASLIHIPNSIKRRTNQGIVVSKGPLVVEDIEIADHVLFNSYTGDKVSLADGGIFFVIPQALIVAKITNSDVVLMDTKTMERVIKERMDEIRMKREGYKNADDRAYNLIDEIEDTLLDRLHSFTQAEGFEF